MIASPFLLQNCGRSEIVTAVFAELATALIDRDRSMRLGIRPDNLVEWIALKLNLGPKPLAETHLAFQFARIVMAATKAGLFEALANGGRSADEIATDCRTHPFPTTKMLDALLAHDYLRFRNGRYELNAMSRKWLLADSPNTLMHKLDFQEIEWRWTEEFDSWLRDGSPRRMHETLTTDEWRRYQWAMRDVSTAPATEFAQRTRLDRNAGTLLDIGGSHGFYSVALCRRHPGLSATILELPQAIPTAAEILKRENIGERVTYQEGNALESDLGERTFDVVLIANLVHHFTDAENREIAAKVARALRPGGVYMVLDAIRISSPDQAKQAGGSLGAILDVYFALTSTSGTWPVETIEGWQRGAGLVPRRPVWLRTMPGAALVSAIKPI